MLSAVRENNVWQKSKKSFWLSIRCWRYVWQIGELRRKRSSMNKMIYFDISKRSVNNGMNCGRGTLE